MRRYRKAKIVATLGPSSAEFEVIQSLFLAGADVFRLNFSHGSYEDHIERLNIIRSLEKIHGNPITVMVDLQGPKLRIGSFLDGRVTLREGHTFTLDLNPTPGSHERINFPHPQIFKCLTPGHNLLLDDGKIRLRVEQSDENQALCTVVVGGELSNRKGVNIPDAALPISAMTDKDKEDLAFALKHDIDWVALSFVQRPEDVIEAKELIQGRAKIMAKLEKPMAIAHLDEIIKLADGVMVARGDLGVEMPLEQVPIIQKRVITQCRIAGKPVVVATQMLDSMVHTPSPTRAETSDVATAIYDGVDAVMLSAESASGAYPTQAVSTMDRIIKSIESDPLYKKMMADQRQDPEQTMADAITTAARQIAQTIKVSAVITLTESGNTTFRAARERPESPILALTPKLSVARFLGIVWGTHAFTTEETYSFTQMLETATATAAKEGFAIPGENMVLIAGVPVGQSGITNILRIVEVKGENPQ